MKNRTELAKYFARMGFKRGAEIGVAYGIFSKILLELIPNLNLLCIDPWFRRRRRRAFPETLKLLSPYPGATIIRASSMDAVKLIPNKWLDFVFIDADHTYESVWDDIQGWTKRVRRGGIVSGHDYYHSASGTLGVIRAVDEYVNKKGYELKLTEWNKKDPLRDERQPSWWFIKK